jgi:hypothetical protein
MTGRALGAAALLLMGMAARADAETPATPVILDVPYVAQSEDLCGGAAAAMVMRFWGARGIGAEAFASIVDPRAHGIPSEAVAAALRARGWRVYVLGAEDEIVRHHIDAGRPVIALIRVAPLRLHYVVIVSWTDRHVVFHDPALAPFRSMSVAAFDRAWRATDRLMLIVLPPTDGAEAPPRADAGLAPPPSCASQLARGIALATDRSFDAAIVQLRAAQAACPESSAPLTELAGVQLLQSNLRSAEATAALATRLNPFDTHAWRTLATSRYLLHETDAALDAWNHAGEPVLDLVRVDGLSRTKNAVASQAIGVSPGTVLTPQTMELARQRLEDLPAASSSRLEYTPVGRGQTELHASVVEPSVVPSGWFDAGGLALGTAINRELAWTFTSPTRNGEAIFAQWRWWENRPRVGLSASVPLTPGVLTIEGFFERQTFSTREASQAVVVDDRRSVSVGLHNWATPWLRWTATLGADQWNGLGTLPRATAGLGVRAARDHVAMGVSATAWPGRAGFTSTRAGIRWRSSVDPVDASLTAIIDGVAVTGSAPHDLWPGADTGQATSTLLRAHTSLVRGVVVNEAFGRQLVHVTGEWQSRSKPFWLAHIRGALFVDGARAWRGDYSRDRALVDAGAGVRVGLSGRGAIRIDVAHGLSDGANAISADWVMPWRAW